MARSISMMGVVMAILFFSAIVTAQTSKSLRVGGHEETRDSEMNSFKLEVGVNSLGQFGASKGQRDSYPYGTFSPFYPYTCYARATPKPLDQIGLGSNCKELAVVPVTLDWQDDASRSAMNALQADKQNKAAQAEVLFFFRKFIYLVINRMAHKRDIAGKKACYATDIPDCNVVEANRLAQSGWVDFKYDSSRFVIKADFKIMACTALMAELTKCRDPVKSAAGLQQSLNVGMFCAGTSYAYCQGELQSIVDEAAASVSAQSSAFVKLLKLPSPRLLKEGVQRELPVVAAKKPKLIGAVSAGAATTKKGI